MPDPVLHGQRGPLTGITDEAARKEIGKLWDFVEVREKPGSGNRFITRDELTLELRKITPTTVAEQSGFVNTTLGGGGIATGTDLLVTDNTWTGHNTWERKSGKDDPPARFESLRGVYPIEIKPALPEGQILIDKGYTTLIDVRKSSSNKDEASSGGGNAAIYVQHRVDGSVATINNVSCGIRVQTETQQVSTAPVNDVVCGYFGLLSKGVNVGAFGVHVDLYHRSLGNSISYAFDAQMFRWSADGKTVAYHARAVTDSAQGTRHSSAAFLASPGGAGTIGFLSLFQGGSDYTGGVVQCQYGLDLALASCDVAAITIPANKRVLLNGKAGQNVGFYFDSGGALQFFSDVGGTFAFGNEGSFIVNNPHTAGFTAPSPAGGLALGNPMGVWLVNLGGFIRGIPFYPMS